MPRLSLRLLGRASALALMAVLLGYAATRPLGLYDEGFALTNALRLLQGDLPHVDYWAAYPAGTSLVLSAAFWLSHADLWVARLVDLGWRLLLLGSLHAALHPFVPRWAGWLATVLAALWLAVGLPPSYSVVPALALLWLMLALCTHGLEHRRTGYAVASGFVGGMGVLFRLDFAAYGWLALAAASLLCAIPAPWRHAGAQPRYLLLYLVRCLLVYGAVAAVVLLVLTLLSGREFLEQTLWVPATVMREHRLLPVPVWWSWPVQQPVRWLLAWLAPLAAVLVGVLALCVRPPHRRGLLSTRAATEGPAAHQALLLWYLLALVVLLTLQGHNRLDIAHASPSLIVAGAALASLTGRVQGASLLARLFSAVLLLCFAGESVYVADTYFDQRQVRECLGQDERAACPRQDPAQQDVVRYINQHYPHAWPVFVGNARHDLVIVNDASLYFLLGRPVPVKWNEMHPGIVTTAAVQRAMIGQLQHHRVPLVVLADMPTPLEPNASAVPSGVHLLDEYIASHYRPVYASGRYRVLERQDPG